MNLDFTTIIGLLASLFTTASLVPQLIKVAREKKSGDVSILMMATLFTGLACWIYYGILKEDWIIIISNTVALILNGFSTWLVVKYK